MSGGLPRRIHWLSWQPTPYNESLFRFLAQERAIDLMVHYRSEGVASHPWKSAMTQGYRTRFYRMFLGLDWRVASLAIQDRRAFYFVAGWDHPTSQLLLTLLRMLKRSYALWSDTPDLERRRAGLYSLLRSAWLRWVFAGATRIMGTGRPALQGLGKMGAAENQLVNFPYWIDLKSYEGKLRPNACDEGRAMRFVSSGRIRNSLKGHDIAIRALALAAKNSEIPFEYYIAGAGPDEQSLTQLIQSLGLTDRVKILGWLEPDALRDLYRSADALIHPSPMHEPYGVVVIEAMAAGLVVLASDRTGAALDRIDHACNGFIHPAGNIAELARQIERILHDPRSIVEIGMRAQATAKLWPLDRAASIIIEMLQAG